MNAPANLAQFATPLQCLFQPMRTKVLYGGRAAGRSWGIARALLIIGVSRKIRVLCARELQNSISESVHAVLSDQIALLGLEAEYTIYENKIIGRNGTDFYFAGIKNNSTKIKSYEGIDYCWVEEANKVSRKSWTDLIPTIRKPGSEIWISFNPELEDDYTYVRFVKQADESMFVRKMTWRDNPWFPESLRVEMERDKREDYDHYLNVWEGFCLETLEGTVYAKEMRAAQAEGRIMQVPYHRDTPVDTYWDLGRADNTSIWFVQRVAMQYRILDYYEAAGEDVPHFLLELQNRRYVYGTHHLPHDGKQLRLGMRKSIKGQIEVAYPDRVKIIEKQAITDGINAARMILPNCYFDEDRCAAGLKALRHYRFKMRATGPGGTMQRDNVPVHDWASDGADAFRMFAIEQLAPRKRNNVLHRLEMAEQARADAFRSSNSAGFGWMG